MNPPPTSLRIAAGCWLATAVFGLLNVISLWFLRQQVADRAKVPVGEVTGLVVSITLVTLVFAGAYVYLTLKLYRRRRWARGVISAVAVAHMLWLLLLGVSAATLVTLLLISVGAVLTWNPRTAQWIAEKGE